MSGGRRSGRGGRRRRGGGGRRRSGGAREGRVDLDFQLLPDVAIVADGGDEVALARGREVEHRWASHHYVARHFHAVVVLLLGHLHNVFGPVPVEH